MLGHVLLVRRAHPRSRGEHYHKQAKQMRDRDSSPLARGTRSPAAPLHRNARLIPARAGNTTRASPSSVPSSAHPRSRGEHQLLDLCRSRNYGSSPLARGTLIALIGSVLVLRLIPARAGNTPGLSPPRRQWSAHPRSRGEHREYPPGFFAGFGSSPLARGTRRERSGMNHASGLIPARAGNTRARNTGIFARGAHPRSRGEHGTGAEQAEGRRGSSPLARGTRPLNR